MGKPFQCDIDMYVHAQSQKANHSRIKPQQLAPNPSWLASYLAFTHNMWQGETRQAKTPAGTEHISVYVLIHLVMLLLWFQSDGTGLEVEDALSPMRRLKSGWETK